MGQITVSPGSQMRPNWGSRQYTGRWSCCSGESQQAGKAGWQGPREVQRQSPASGMDNPIQQDRLDIEKNSTEKDLEILVNNLNRNQPYILAAKINCTLGCMSRNTTSRSRDGMIKGVLEVQTTRAGKEKIIPHHDHLITFWWERSPENSRDDKQISDSSQPRSK